MGGPWGTACDCDAADVEDAPDGGVPDDDVPGGGAPVGDAAALPAAVESGFCAVAGVPGEVGGVPGAGVTGVLDVDAAAEVTACGRPVFKPAAAASESWCALFCTRLIESRMARRARTMESCRTESRCERCFTVLSCRIVDGVVSCGLTIDVSGGRTESDCARSPQDIRSKKR